MLKKLVFILQFKKWNENQKHLIVDDILQNLSTKHLVMISGILY